MLRLAQQLASLPPAALAAIGYFVVQLAQLGWRGRHHPHQPADLSRIVETGMGIGVSCGGRITSVNDVLARALGYQPHELIGAETTGLVAGPHTTETGVPVPFSASIPYRHKLGHIVPIQITAYPVVTEPGKVMWVGLFQPEAQP
jgi:PAS domain-containing protein